MGDNLLQAKINLFNALVQDLRASGIEINDPQDFDFVIDYIRYSPAQDRVIVEFRDAMKEAI